MDEEGVKLSTDLTRDILNGTRQDEVDSGNRRY